MNKPEHLSRAVGDQFGDKSIVQNYGYRPSYSQAVINTLSECRGLKEMSVLDIGSGTGEVSIPLSLKGHSVVGVDPSAEMIKVARAKGSNVRFVNSYIEDFESEQRFQLFVAANSIHWPDWSATFPLLKKLSANNAKLAIVTGGDLLVEAIQSQILEAVKTYSTTRNFKPYSVVEMLKEQGYIKNVKVYELPTETVVQTCQAYLSSFHARNGFSLDRMTKEQAARFDSEIMKILKQRGFEETVTGTVHFKVFVSDIAVP